jgi:Anti-sigma-K factor rskA
MSESSSSQPISESIQELMAGYVLNTLSAEEAEDFERYLHHHPELATPMRELEELMGLMASAVPPVSAPTRLRSKILKIAQPSPRIAPLWQLPIRHWSRVATVAAALLLLALGIDNCLLRRKLALREQAIIALENSESHQLQNVALMNATFSALQGHETYLFSLRGTDAATDASGSVVLDLESGIALVALQNLPPLPSGEAYHLWAFTEDKKIPCGTFNTDTSGRIVDQVAVPIPEYTSPVVFMRISKDSATVPPDSSHKELMMTSEI